MDIFILVTTCVANLLLGLVVLLRNHKGIAERIFALLTVMISLWILMNYFANYPIGGSLEFGDVANKLAFASSMILIGTALAFTYFFPLRRKVRTAELIIVIGSIVTMTILSCTYYVAGRVYFVSEGHLGFTEGPLLWLYALVFLGATVLAVRNLVTVTGIKEAHIKKQAWFVMIGISVSATGGLLTNIVIPALANEWHTTRFGPLVTVVLVGSMAYAIIKHHLFDIKFAAVRTIAYACVLLTLSAVYYLFAYIVSVVAFGGNISNDINIGMGPLNIILALFLAFLFQPIKKFFDRTTNRIFYRDHYKSEEFFADLSQLLASTTELRGLLERSANKIAATLKAEQAFFFVYYTNGVHHHISAGTPRHDKVPIYDIRMLDKYVANNKELLILTDLMPKDSSIRRMLVSHKVALVMPLHYDDQVLGYVCLGDQQGGGYTERDLKILPTIADELVIAIQNALSLHEIKEINATLQQRIDNATKELRSSNAQLRHLDEVKDEFMSMASHQLRTPLTSVKGYLSMVIEGDTGEISPQQRRVLEEAFNSSERMVRLIADFLNVSRLQTGKFVVEKAPSDIVKVVKDEVSSLKIIAKTHDMKLVFKMPDRPLPTVRVDEAKIRQVIMNFVDNAIYYSKPNTTVQVVLERIDNDLAFKVIDTGIGVPVDEQSKLFNKFFRAKNARKQRPDGTGVGLYLAKKVITAHRGKMIFSSEEGKGSTFGFRIPLDQV